MKRTLLIAAALLLGFLSKAQDRKYMSNFQSFQSYFNPAMTGFEGTRATITYRSSQWIGYDGAPKTYRMAADFNNGGKNSYGIFLMQDSFGPYKENQVLVNYGFHIDLTNTVQLRAGAAMTLDVNRVDLSGLLMVQQNDPAYQDFAVNSGKTSRVDFNMGMALTSSNSYIGYTLQNASKGALNGKADLLGNSGNFQHVLQAGLRMPLGPTMGLSFTGLFRTDPIQGQSFETMVKGVFHNTAWLGVGYRKDMAYVGSIGFCVNDLRFGFAYELPGHAATSLNTRTSELVVAYKFNTSRRMGYNHYRKASKNKMNIW